MATPFKVQSKYILFFILLVAAALRFYHVDYQSVWLDEICSIVEANPATKWSDLEPALLMSDPHPPMYFALLKIMFQWFGYTTFVARVLSAVLGVLGVYAVYLLGKEVKSQRVGLIAAALLAVNYFHIYYSQEVRMYSLLFLTTTLSFYGLFRFLKNHSLRNAAVYGIFSGLMLLSHFFGLFVLASQFFILLVCLIKTKNAEKKPFVIGGALAIGVMVLCFLPALRIFIETTKKSYTTIPPTTPEIIKQIFRDFAEDSTLLLVLSSLAILFFVFIFFKKRSNKQDRDGLTLFVLFAWILITLIIPIIRSYLVSPMIVSRYFIAILPAFVLLIALGIDRIKPKLAILAFLLGFILVSGYELIFKNDYYHTITKAQYRETAQFIIKENEMKDPVVNELKWYLNYLLNNGAVQTSIIEKSFEEYVTNMKTNPISMKSFWYFDIFTNTRQLSPESEKFLKEHFTADKTLHSYNANAVHYTLKSGGLNGVSLIETPIALSAITDENWYGGVGIVYNMLLTDYSAEKENNLKNALGLKFKDGRTVSINSYEKAGAYLHIKIDGTANAYKDVACYPNSVTLVSKKQ